MKCCACNITKLVFEICFLPEYRWCRTMPLDIRRNVWSIGFRGYKTPCYLNLFPGSIQHIVKFSWWRHQMETFSALLAICAGNSPVPGPGEFLTQRPVTRSFDVFFDLRLNKRLGNQWWGWWFETLSRALWCHRNGCCNMDTLSVLLTLSLLGGSQVESW